MVINVYERYHRAEHGARILWNEPLRDARRA